MVAPGADPGHAHEHEDQRNGRERDEDAEIHILHLRELEGEKDVNEGGYDRDVEGIAEEHRDPRQAPPLGGGEEHLALPGREARPRQKRDHLKARLLVRQSREAEQDRKELRDDPVDQDHQRKQDKIVIDVHGLTSPWER